MWEKPASALDAPFALTASEVCSIIVTYNPDTLSLECIRTVMEHSACTLVIDNASEASAFQRLKESLDLSRVTLIQNIENSGVSAALNQGIREAKTKGFGWYLLFDQDTRIFPTTVDQLIQTYDECARANASPIGLFGTNYYPTDADGAINESRVPFSFGKTWVAAELIITSGTLISRDSFECLGEFREDYFIDHVDHEYCLRAMAKGRMVATTVLPLMTHRLGMISLRRSLLSFGKKKRVLMYSPRRRYYQVRNFGLLVQTYGDKFPKVIEFIRRSNRSELKRALLYQGQLFRNALALYLGTRDGRRGVSGRYRGRCF